jgi:hypothetical protein
MCRQADRRLDACVNERVICGIDALKGELARAQLLRVCRLLSAFVVHRMLYLTSAAIVNEVCGIRTQIECPNSVAGPAVGWPWSFQGAAGTSVRAAACEVRIGDPVGVGCGGSTVPPGDQPGRTSMSTTASCVGTGHESGSGSFASAGTVDDGQSGRAASSTRESSACWTPSSPNCLLRLEAPVDE